MKTAQLKLISALVPYIAVLIGLYVLKNAWVAMVLYHFGLTAFLIFGDRNNLLKKVCTGWNSVSAVLGIAMSVMILPIMFFCWEYMRLDNIALKSALANFGLQGTSWFFFMIYFSTVQPILEELYWRGWLGYEQKHFSWTDFTFAGYHIFVLAWFIKPPWLITAFIVLTATAYIWRYLASRLKGLAVPLLAHIAADVSIMAATFILIR